MKTVFSFFILFLAISLNAQRIGISTEQRKKFDSPINTSEIFSVPDKGTKSTAFEKSNEAEWKKSADRIIASGHRIYSTKMVDSNIIWMVSTRDAFPPPADELPYVLKSLDGGKTWEQYSVPGTAGRYAYDIVPIDENVAYAIIHDDDPFDDNIGSFMYKTADGGLNWQQIDNFPFIPLSGHFFNEKEGWLFVGDTTGFATSGLPWIAMSVTEDGGETWNHAGGTPWIIPEGRSLPVQDATDGFWRWAFSVSSLYEVVDSTIIMGTVKNYWISTDRGYNWEAISSPLHATDRVTTMVAMKNRDTFMIASNLSTEPDLVSPRTYLTTDGGQTWVESSPPGHLADIHYLPGTTHSFISVGHRNFGFGEVGTFRTDDGVNWTKVDDLPLINMDFAGQNQGTGVLGNIPGLGDNGNIYKWEAVPLYGADVELFVSPNYTIGKAEHIGAVIFDYAITNIGQLDLNTIDLSMIVTKEEALFYQDAQTISTLGTASLEIVAFEYTPTELGIYDARIAANNPELGENFSVINRSFELSATTLAKDDGTAEMNIGFGFANPRWYGYYGSEFELLTEDTLVSISVAIAPDSEPNGSFNFNIRRTTGAVVSPSITYQSPFVNVGDALANTVGNFYTYELEEPLYLTAGKYVFAVGQDSIQGMVGFGFDTDTASDGYWIESPVAEGGFRWTKRDGETTLLTLLLRPNFVASDLISSTEQVESEGVPFKIYPNPFSDQLYLLNKVGQNEALEVALLDLQGRTLARTILQGNEVRNLDWSSLAKGIYFVKVTDGQQFWVEKIVKQ